jgi:hypothetical protein
MFGRKTEEEKALEQREKALMLELKMKRGIMYYEKYLGGLGNYATEQHVKIWIFPERLEITPLGIKIPYTKLRDIKSAQAGKRFSSSGLFWMADRIVTTLEYTDGSEDPQKIFMDFGENTKYVQPRIYENMMKARAETSKVTHGAE